MEIYLKQHNFTYENLRIVLFIQNGLGNQVWHPDIRTCSLDEGNLTFSTYIPSEEFYSKNETYIKEPYIEIAKQLGVWEELPSCPYF